MATNLISTIDYTDYGINGDIYRSYNVGKAAGTTANNYQTAADTSMANAVNGDASRTEYGRAAKDSYDTAKSVLTNSLDQSSQSYTDALKASAAADNMSTDIENVRSSAAGISRMTNDYDSIIASLTNAGNTQLSNGTTLSGLGTGLYNLDGSMGGVAGEYMKLYNALSGDNQVSMAASDVQSAYQNAAGQQQRNLARQGVSASSGASQALQQQYNQSLATALAAAKTRARRTAIGDQASMLGNLTTAANNLLTAGNQATQTGINAQTSAANVMGQKSSNAIAAADLYAKAGTLTASQASAYNTAAQTRNAATDAITSALSSVVSASSNMTNAANTYIQAQQNAANYYAQVAEGYAELASANGGEKYLFGATGSGGLVGHGNTYFNGGYFWG